MVKDKLYSPPGRAISNMVTTFGSGVLCGAVVTDITVDGKLVWRNIFSSETALITLILFGLATAYYIGMYNVDVINDAVLKNYQDKNALIAMLRKGYLKTLIKRANKGIKKGDFSELPTIDEVMKGEYSHDKHSHNKPSQTKDTTAN
ncbi:hypothetical protein ACFY5J_12725 [Peribacillus butanolivorans]|uniref:hypothetical protein n=1 Tax=Peribacillus butanolivorans TaxID=421767 RepID=UPI0036742A08